MSRRARLSSMRLANTMSPAQPVVSAPVTTQAADDSSLSQENRTDPQGISPDETSGDLATLDSS